MTIIRRTIALAPLLALASCTAVLVEATDERGIQEDPGRRTFGTMVEDEAIETKVAVNLESQEPAFRRANYNVVSLNGTVLITGQVESEELKARASRIASEASVEIKRIQNELTVSENTGLLSRGEDTMVALGVRAQLALNREAPGGRIKVVVENGTVYLMGLVTQAQGDAAGRIAGGSPGVDRVVKLFEYID